MIVQTNTDSILRDRVSTNFTYTEMVRSETAARKGINNTPTRTEISNYRQLCMNVLEPIRAYFGNLPVNITSGYRSVKLNQAIGGSANSQHCKGEAADFYISRSPLWKTFTLIAAGNFIFDQLIFEFGAWVHVSYSTVNNRHQSLIATKQTYRTAFGQRKQKTVYEIFE